MSISSTAAAVEVQALVKRYGSVTAVDGVSFVAPHGVITAVLGPNGAGKTTTVEVCEGFRTSDGGAVTVLGRDPRRDRSNLAPRVGVMLQDGGLYPSAKAGELLAHASRLYAHPHHPAELVERLGLSSVGGTPVRRLSGGEQRRLAFAVAVIGRPELLFLDEPTAGLDPQSRAAVWDIVGELRSAGVSIVLTTHLLEEAERVADHVVIIDRGRVLVESSLDELLAQGFSAEITLRADSGLPLDSLRAQLPSGCSAAEIAPGEYVITGPVDGSVTALAVSWCTSVGSTPREIGLRTRSLEDIFLDLTGREMRP